MLYWGRRTELQTHYQPWQESHLKEMAGQNKINDRINIGAN